MGDISYIIKKKWGQPSEWGNRRKYAKPRLNIVSVIKLHIDSISLNLRQKEKP